MSYPFRQAYHDLGIARGPRLGFLVHMAEGGGTVEFLAKPNRDGVSVHYVVERSGRIVQMLLESHMHSSVRIRNADGSSAIRLDDGPAPYGRTAALEVLGEWADTRRTLGPNHATIAVELEGFAADGPNADQAAALVELVDDVRSRHPVIGLLGHRDFASYKACPGAHIDWPALGGHGKGGSEPMDELEVIGGPMVLDVQLGEDVLNVDGSARLAAPAKRAGVHSPFATISAGGTRLRTIVWTRPDPTPDLLLAVYENRHDDDLRPVPTPPGDCSLEVQHELDLAAIRAANAVKARP